jgi:hypothetical protein
MKLKHFPDEFNSLDGGELIGCVGYKKEPKFFTVNDNSMGNNYYKMKYLVLLFFVKNKIITVKEIIWSPWNDPKILSLDFEIGFDRAKGWIENQSSYNSCNTPFFVEWNKDNKYGKLLMATYALSLL